MNTILDLLNTQEDLKTLPEDQKKQIESIFTAQLGAQHKKIHSTYDGLVKEVLGEDKPGGTLSSDFIKNKLTGLLSERDTLKEELKGKIPEGAAKQKLADAEKLVTDLRTELSEAEAKFNANLHSIKVNNHLATALNKLKFVDEETIPKVVRDSYVKSALAEIQNEFKLELGEDGGAVYRNKTTGDIHANKSNALRPYTTEELLAEKLKHVTKQNVVREGLGLNTKVIKAPGIESDIKITASSKIEADEQIRKALSAKGIETSSNKYQDMFSKARAANNVSELPTR